MHWTGDAVMQPGAAGRECKRVSATALQAQGLPPAGLWRVPKYQFCMHKRQPRDCLTPAVCQERQIAAIPKLAQVLFCTQGIVRCKVHAVQSGPTSWGW